MCPGELRWSAFNPRKEPTMPRQPSLLVLMLLVFSTGSLAENPQALLAEQDARERQAALAFAESRGLDLENAVESDTGLRLAGDK